MTSTVKQKIISFSAATALLSQIFLAHAGYAQDEAGPLAGSPEIYSDNVAEVPPQTDGPRIRALLQDLSDHPLAGGPISIEVCSSDALDSTDCDIITTELPMPELSNPVGYEVQHLRRSLAYGLEQANRGEDGKPLPAEVQRVALDVAGQFETFFNEQSTAFPKHETLITMMDMHYELLGIAETQDLQAAEAFIGELRSVILKLEDDLLTDAEKALRDIQERIKEALEEGASQEEFEKLNEEAREAMEEYMQEQQESGELTEEQLEALEQMQQLMEDLQKLMEELGITPEQLAEMMQQMMQGMSGSSPSMPSGPMSEQDYQKMLEQLQQQMEQMQKMQKYMEELGEITRLQQELRDETLSEALREEQGLPPEDPAEQEPHEQEPAEPNMQEEGEDGSDNDENAPEEPEADFAPTLEDRQEALRERLNDVIEDMKKEDLDPGDLSTALDEMDEAIEDLELDREGDGVVDQDEALEALNQGGEQMQQMMMMMLMPGQGNQSGTEDGPSDSSGDQLRGDSGVLDENGRLRGPSNRNGDLGVSPEAEDNRSREYRDNILERQRQQDRNSGGSNYLDRLLDGPDGP